MNEAVEDAKVQHAVSPVEMKLSEHGNRHHPEQDLRHRRGIGECGRVRDVRERAGRPEPHKDDLPNRPLECPEECVPHVVAHPPKAGALLGLELARREGQVVERHIPVADVGHGDAAVNSKPGEDPRGGEPVLRTAFRLEVVRQAKIHRERDH